MTSVLPDDNFTGLPALPRRSVDAHKGTFGVSLVVGGSREMLGAVLLAAHAALRSGVGLCRLVVPAGVQPCVAVALPEATSSPAAEADGAFAAAAAATVCHAAASATSLTIGPGLSQAGEIAEFVASVLERVAVPLVVDADALNSSSLEAIAQRSAPTVLTPHPGEAGRLLGVEAREVQADRIGAVHELRERSGATVVLKGAGSLISGVGGVVRNDTGNPGMATGGTGDVLAGVIGALLAQGMAPFDAARLGVWAHGRAGDLAALAGSMAGLLASDVVQALPLVWRELETV